mgnify:CR=1 FL=1
MINHIIEAIAALICVTLVAVSFGSFVFMWFVFYNGDIFPGLFLLVVSVLSMATSNWLIENGWRFRQ